MLQSAMDATLRNEYELISHKHSNDETFIDCMDRTFWNPDNCGGTDL